ARATTMATAQAGIILRHIREVVAAGQTGRLPDNQLLERFTTRREEAAFRTLLARHGPLVLAVCRRGLHNYHDAEDAFQATFLVLARRAGSIAKQGSVASWLHGVAYHVASKARAHAAARRLRERRAGSPPSSDPLEEVTGRELATV